MRSWSGCRSAATSSTPANANEYPGHDLLNLRVGWSFRDNWSTTLRLNNVTDRAYADRADFAFGNYRYFPGRGRTVFVEVRYSEVSEQASEA